MFAEVNGHGDVVAWLEASRGYSPLHHVEVLTEGRAVELLRADVGRVGVRSTPVGLRRMGMRAPFWSYRTPVTPVSLAENIQVSYEEEERKIILELRSQSSYVSHEYLIFPGDRILPHPRNS